MKKIEFRTNRDNLIQLVNSRRCACFENIDPGFDLVRGRELDY
jgi:hypothetical protein